MMRVPEGFARQLKAEFDGQIRVRWSGARKCWQIERKAARAVEGARPANDDRRIRALDGYYLVMEVALGSQLRCPFCDRYTRIPIRQRREAKCERCGKAFRAVCWPLGDSLLEYLRFGDPDRGGIERVFQWADQGEGQRALLARRDRHNQTEAIWKEDWKQAFGVPSVGFTGKERFHA